MTHPVFVRGLAKSPNEISIACHHCTGMTEKLRVTASTFALSFHSVMTTQMHPSDVDYAETKVSSVNGIFPVG